jgi:hypothetical protein
MRCVFFMLVMRKSAYVAAKCLASSGVGSAISGWRSLGNSIGGRVVVSPVLISLEDNMTPETYPASIFRYDIISGQCRAGDLDQLHTIVYSGLFHFCF